MHKSNWIISAGRGENKTSLKCWKHQLENNLYKIVIIDKGQHGGDPRILKETQDGPSGGKTLLVEDSTIYHVIWGGYKVTQLVVI